LPSPTRKKSCLLCLKVSAAYKTGCGCRKGIQDSFPLQNTRLLRYFYSWSAFYSKYNETWVMNYSSPSPAPPHANIHHQSIIITGRGIIYRPLLATQMRPLDGRTSPHQLISSSAHQFISSSAHQLPFHRLFFRFHRIGLDKPF
jgi:hypothetical protein